MLQLRVDAERSEVFAPTMKAVDATLCRRARLSLPNLLTYGRIAAVPLVVGLHVLAGDPAGRPVAALGRARDLHRRRHHRFLRRLSRAHAGASNRALGRMLDPIADKLLVASCLLMLAADETIKGWSLFAAIIILCREILVSGLREYLAELRVSVPVTQLAKWKTTLQLVAIGFLLGGEAGDFVCRNGSWPGAGNSATNRCR